MSYEGVMRLAQEHHTSTAGDLQVDWLKVVRGCYEEAESHRGNRFAASWVSKRRKPGWFPGLTMLAEKFGILRQLPKTSNVRFYVMPDREGVARALRELGYLQ